MKNASMKSLVPGLIAGAIIGFTLWSYLRSTGIMQNDNIAYALLFAGVGAVSSALGGILASAVAAAGVAP